MMLARKSDLFNYFRNIVQKDDLILGQLANEQIYFFSHASSFPKYTYSYSINTIRSHIKIGQQFYIVPIDNIISIFPNRFIKLNNSEISWKEGNFIRHSFGMYLSLALINKFNLRRFKLGNHIIFLK
jgi:hypothetical protein